MSTAPYTVEIGGDLWLRINSFHNDNPGEGMTLNAAEVAELAGCADPACTGNERSGEKEP